MKYNKTEVDDIENKALADHEDISDDAPTFGGHRDRLLYDCMKRKKKERSARFRYILATIVAVVTVAAAVALVVVFG